MSKRKLGENIDLLEMLECAICMGNMLPPFFQCMNGHIICKSCQSRVDKCPSCRCTTINIRNLQLEKIAAKIKVPCRHGCSALLSYLEESEHAAMYCTKRPLKCPYDTCKFCTAKSKELALHLESEHHIKVQSFPMDKNLVTKEGEEVDNCSYWTGILHDNNNDRYFQYKFVRSSSENTAIDYHAAYLLALDRANTIIKYMVTIKGRDREYTFKGPVLGYDYHKTPPNNLDCLVIPLHMVKWLGRKDDNDNKSFSLQLKIELIQD